MVPAVSELDRLLNTYRDACKRTQAALSLRSEDKVCLGFIAEEKQARQAIVDYLCNTTFPKSQVHIHECGTCGQLRECHHAQCFYNVLADCDPGHGHKTPARAEE